MYHEPDGAEPRGAAAAPYWPGRSQTGRPQVSGPWENGDAASYPYAAVLPLLRREEVIGALVLVGDARDPFTALDDRFLVALGQQVGAALENADLHSRLQARTVELARLSARMIEQHEEERRRLSRELHDETAQVFSAVKMELGVLARVCPTRRPPRSDQVLGLIDTGIRSIRNVTNDLRPSLLDDLGLLPALRSLVADFGERSGIVTELAAPLSLPQLSEEAELALFRALQEALSNVLRHAGARSVDIGLSVTESGVLLEVLDDGAGPSEFTLERPRSTMDTWGWPECGSGSRHSGAGALRLAEARRRRVARGDRPGRSPGGGMTKPPIRVLVADDHAIVRTGIRHVLEGEPGFAVVGEAVQRRGDARAGRKAPARRGGDGHFDARRVGSSYPQSSGDSVPRHGY